MTTPTLPSLSHNSCPPCSPLALMSCRFLVWLNCPFLFLSLTTLQTRRVSLVLLHLRVSRPLWQLLLSQRAFVSNRFTHASSLTVRLASPWVATCAVSPAPLAPHGAQPEQHEGAPEAKMVTQGSPSSTAPLTSPALSATSPASTAVPSDVPSGFMCQYCQQYNTLRSAGDTWYTVTAG